MLDSDVVFPLDPRRMFMDPKCDCVYMMNIGNFVQEARYQVPYSYPFLGAGVHATVNNGIVASRASQSSLKLWEKSIDMVLNHVSGDPQHPHNQLLYTLGLRLQKVPVDGYPNLSDRLGYYEGTAILHVNKNDTLPLLVVRAVATAAAYDRASVDVVNQQVAIHAVGVGGMGHKQDVKCEFLKKIGFWYGNTSCAL